MARLLLAIIVFAMVVAVLKMVVVALVIAGLIFRTKETIGLLVIGAALAFTAAFPLVALVLAAVIGLWALLRNTPTLGDKTTDRRGEPPPT